MSDRDVGGPRWQGIRHAGLRCNAVKDAPDFEIHLTCGDTLLHAPAQQCRPPLATGRPFIVRTPPEDLDALQNILRPDHYRAVVANPPYITPKDRLLNQAVTEHS